MYLTRTVGPKGQVVVPQPIRERTGISEGTEVIFDVEGERVVMMKKEGPEKALENFINSIPREKRTRRKIDFKKIYEEQYDERFPSLPGR